MSFCILSTERGRARLYENPTQHFKVIVFKATLGLLNIEPTKMLTSVDFHAYLA
jgi:hypothetical protein